VRFVHLFRVLPIKGLDTFISIQRKPFCCFAAANFEPHARNNFLSTFYRDIAFQIDYFCAPRFISRGSNGTPKKNCSCCGFCGGEEIPFESASTRPFLRRQHPAVSFTCLSPEHISEPFALQLSHSDPIRHLRLRSPNNNKKKIVDLHPFEPSNTVSNMLVSAFFSCRIMASQGVSKSGFLTKEGAVRKNWKKRWFVLKGQELSYFKTQVRSAGKPSHLITLIFM
jgi:hypothetical protein